MDNDKKDSKDQHENRVMSQVSDKLAKLAEF